MFLRSGNRGRFPRRSGSRGRFPRRSGSRGRFVQRSEELDRCYGFFKCEKCGSHWESSHVYCAEGTNDAVYKQECKKCKIGYLPYKVEPIKCSRCGEISEFCECPKKEHHVDKNKPHRADLCLKCRSGDPCA